MNNHDLALLYLKRRLQLAWDMNLVQEEIETYDLIGVEYFYLNDIEKAESYHNMAMNGQSLSSNSQLRTLCEKSLHYKRNELLSTTRNNLFLFPIEIQNRISKQLWENYLKKTSKKMEYKPMKDLLNKDSLKNARLPSPYSWNCINDCNQKMLEKSNEEIREEEKANRILLFNIV